MSEWHNHQGVIMTIFHAGYLLVVLCFNIHKTCVVQLDSWLESWHTKNWKTKGLDWSGWRGQLGVNFLSIQQPSLTLSDIPVSPFFPCWYFYGKGQVAKPNCQLMKFNRSLATSPPPHRALGDLIFKALLENQLCMRLLSISFGVKMSCVIIDLMF